MSSALPEPDFPYSLACNAYGFYCVPDAYRNREVPMILARGGIYEPDTLRLIRRMAKGGDVVAGGAGATVEDAKLDAISKAEDNETPLGPDAFVVISSCPDE